MRWARNRRHAIFPIRQHSTSVGDSHQVKSPLGSVVDPPSDPWAWCFLDRQGPAAAQGKPKRGYPDLRKSHTAGRDQLRC
jgi:hypothetical protein